MAWVCATPTCPAAIPLLDEQVVCPTCKLYNPLLEKDSTIMPITITEQTDRDMTLKALALKPCTCTCTYCITCIPCTAARILNRINEYTDDQLHMFFDTFTAIAIYKALGQ